CVARESLVSRWLNSVLTCSTNCRTFWGVTGTSSGTPFGNRRLTTPSSCCCFFIGLPLFSTSSKTGESLGALQTLTVGGWRTTVKPPTPSVHPLLQMLSRTSYCWLPPPRTLSRKDISSARPNYPVFSSERAHFANIVQLQ